LILLFIKDMLLLFLFINFLAYKKLCKHSLNKKINAGDIIIKHLVHKQKSFTQTLKIFIKNYNNKKLKKSENKK